MFSKCNQRIFCIPHFRQYFLICDFRYFRPVSPIYRNNYYRAWIRISALYIKARTIEAEIQEGYFCSLIFIATFVKVNRPTLTYELYNESTGLGERNFATFCDGYFRNVVSSVILSSARREVNPRVFKSVSNLLCNQDNVRNRQ